MLLRLLAPFILVVEDIIELIMYYNDSGFQVLSSLVIGLLARGRERVMTK